MTSDELAGELEVSRRTILRDVVALGEAGLPVIVQAGRRGGIELGFNYRTRLTGLAADEAEALGVLLGRSAVELEELGLGAAGRRASSKLLESLPDPVRDIADLGRRRFHVAAPDQRAPDPRVAALAEAVRRGCVVRIRDQDAARREVHPAGLTLLGDGWHLLDAQDPGRSIPQREWGTVNVSRRRFGDVRAQRRHLMEQPMLGRCGSGTGRPASTSRMAASSSSPVTGTPLPGVEVSIAPR